MSRNYKFHNPEGACFVGFAVVVWIDVFTRSEYKDILLDGLVFRPEDYVYSSDRDYSGEKGLLDNVIVLNL
jgi:hypothetical protein